MRAPPATCSPSSLPDWCKVCTQQLRMSICFVMVFLMLSTAFFGFIMMYLMW